MTNIYPCLWFESDARAAADFYCSIFPNSRVLSAAGISVTWELDGNKFMAFNGGPHDTFNEAVSFMVPCKSQDEIDHYWNALTSGGGKEKTGGWCTDKFGVSWQIVPTILGELMSDPANGKNVFSALMGMTKIDIETLRNA